MFDPPDPPDPMAEALIGVFYCGDRSRSSEASGDILRRRAAQADTTGRADIDDMPGAAVSPVDALRTAIVAEDGGLQAEQMPARATLAARDAPAQLPPPGVFANNTHNPSVMAADDARDAELRAVGGGRCSVWPVFFA